MSGSGVDWCSNRTQTQTSVKPSTYGTRWMTSVSLLSRSSPHHGTVLYGFSPREIETVSEVAIHDAQEPAQVFGGTREARQCHGLQSHGEEVVELRT